MRRVTTAMVAALLAVAAAGAWAGGNPPVAMAVPLPPTPLGPANGGRLDSFEVPLQWGYPGASATKQVHLQVVPFNGDGPSVDVIRNANCCATDGMRIPAPPEWYGMLPDMTSTWRLRGSEATTSIGADDTSWGPWSSGFTFRTPAANTRDTLPTTPFSGANTTETPTLAWRENNPNVFYYEFQLSSDPAFNTDPATATAPVYWNLIHGPLASPPNSYSVPVTAPLARGKTYYWRVRPRVQGDGKPLAWPDPWQIRVP